MTPFPLHTSGIETQSSGKGRHNTMPLKQWVDNFNFAQSWNIFIYICIVLYINQLKLLNESVKNPNRPKSESMTLVVPSSAMFHPPPTHPTLPWIGVDPMKFAIHLMMQYDINMKSTEDCSKIKFDCVQTIHFKSFAWNNDEMLQKWSHHSQDSKGINRRALPSSEASSLSFVYRKVRFIYTRFKQL
jgi:hypothetical protein